MAQKPHKVWTARPERLKRVKELASIGCTIRTICYAIGLHPNQWAIMCNRVPALQEAYGEGLAECEIRDAAVLDEMARAGDRSALDAVKFRLSRVAKWSEKVEQETIVTVKDERLDIDDSDLLKQLTQPTENHSLH